MSRKRRIYNKEFKLELIELVLVKGYSQAEVARNFDLDPALVGKWVRDAKKLKDYTNAFPGKGKMNVEDAEVANLKKQLYKITRERDILKKALGYFANDPE